MIHRNRRNYHIFSQINVVARKCFELKNIRHEIAMGQHRAFRKTSGTAGILQVNEVVAAQIDIGKLHCLPGSQCVEKRDVVVKARIDRG